MPKESSDSTEYVEKNILKIGPWESSEKYNWNLEKSENLTIIHNRKSNEHRFGTRRIPVDGYCK